jgi:UDP-N-acetylmuramate dehydrogenase
MDIKKGLPGVKKGISLKDCTTFKIGGLAKYFFVATKKEELIKAITTATDLKLPFFVLGNGSNLLISDKGFKGLVIKIKNQTSKIKHNLIYTEAGISLGQLVNIALKNNLTGLEWAAGIPGTLGGAINSNAGAFGKSIGDSVIKVEVYDVKDNKIKIFKKRDCKFGYRNSIFKRKKNLIVLSVTIQFKKGNKKEIEKKIKEYLEYRKKTQPLNFPSIGSIFKNFTPYRNEVSGAGPALKNLLRKFGRKNVIPAGWLIEKCGLKGKTIGKAKISEKHGNFIVNLGGAKAKDVKKLIKLVKQKVKSKFGIVLEEEIQYLGFKN